MPAFSVQYRVERPGRSILTGYVEVFVAHPAEARESVVRQLSDRGAVTITSVTQVR